MSYHSFNEYLREHYHYKISEEEEIRTQIYKNRNTNDLTSMVTILKNVRVKTKSKIRISVKEGNIYLNVDVCLYDETFTDEEVTQLLEDLKKQITKDNIIVGCYKISKEDYKFLRSKEL